MHAQEVRELMVQPWQHGDCIDLHGITCEGLLDIAGCNVTGIDLRGAQFPDGINAIGTQFNGVAWFQGAKISKKADFSQSRFMIDATFDRACFACAAEFNNAETYGISQFDFAEFFEGASFQNYIAYGNFSFQGTKIHKQCNFHGAQWLGGIWCDAAQFPENTDFLDSEVYGRLWLRNATRGKVPIDEGQIPLHLGYIYR
ncbi:MAG: pentapeptide repeat-containing protein [Paracoccaceae bacterium]